MVKGIAGDPPPAAALLATLLLTACAGLEPPRPRVDVRHVTVPLEYPGAAIDAGLEADVVMRCTITAAGRAVGCRVVSSTRRLFEAPALAFVAQAPFLPALRDGKPIDTVGKIETISFRLGGHTSDDPPR